MSFFPRLRFTLRFAFVGLVAGWTLSALSTPLHAQQETRLIRNADNEIVFQLDFYGQDQGSSDDFTDAQMDSITEAAQYWVDILKAHGTMPGSGEFEERVDEDGNPILGEDGNPVQFPVTGPVIFEVYYDEALEGNAGAIVNGYVQSAEDGFNLTLPEAIMVDGVAAEPVGGGHATITVGSGWNFTSGDQSAVVTPGDDQITGGSPTAVGQYD